LRKSTSLLMSSNGPLRKEFLKKLKAGFPHNTYERDP
jgi:hypothetical protein